LFLRQLFHADPRAAYTVSKRRKGGVVMKADRNAIHALLMMSDEQLKTVIRSLAARSGVDLGALRITDADIAQVRQALRTATDEDIARAMRQFGLSGGGDGNG
jgi:hypothetical protein